MKIRKNNKDKHNYWIDGLEAGETFFLWIKSFGRAFMLLIIVITSAIYLTQLGITNSKYFGLSILLLQVLRLGVWMYVVGIFLKIFCGWIVNKLSIKELKALEEAANDRREKEKLVFKNSR